MNPELSPALTAGLTSEVTAGVTPGVTPPFAVRDRKRRLAPVLASLEGHDLVLCQITNRAVSGRQTVGLNESASPITYPSIRFETPGCAGSQHSPTVPRPIWYTISLTIFRAMRQVISLIICLVIFLAVSQVIFHAMRQAISLAVCTAVSQAMCRAMRQATCKAIYLAVCTVLCHAMWHDLCPIVSQAVLQAIRHAIYHVLSLTLCHAAPPARRPAGSPHLRSLASSHFTTRPPEHLVTLCQVLTGISP